MQYYYYYIIWKKENSHTRKLRKNSELQGENIELMTLQVLVWTLQPLSHWRLYGKQGQNLIITTRTVMSFSLLFISFYLSS